MAFLFMAPVYSTNLVIDNVRPVLRSGVNQSQPSVIFDLAWDNAWNNSKNHDAVWIFIKFGEYWNNHAYISPIKPPIVLKNRNSKVSILCQRSKSGTGFMIKTNGSFRGNIDLKIQVFLDTARTRINRSKMEGLKVMGLEMVYIPSGPFTLGSPDPAALNFASMYRADGKGQPAGLYRIENEDKIEIGPVSGNLFYQSINELYNGDQKGPIPASFPKGFDPFYIMKYELNQGQYVDFLNTLPDNWTYQRSPIGGRGYHQNRGGIYLENGSYEAKNPKRPMNFISWTDGCAYMDWAGLRPLTELEYEKACRGPGTPIAGEFVWGTNNYDRLERFVDTDKNLKLKNDWVESQLNDNNRDVFGASYYWVMDLSGSVWEKVITIGNAIGRDFTGSHGDGKLSFGKADNPDWPDSNDEKGGFGYRGGGFYYEPHYSDFNPHSPIGYRFYGAWSGGPRSIAYGCRAGLSNLE